MKALVINNTNLYYQVNFNEQEYDTILYTEFFLDIKTKLVKKYWLFGPLVEVDDSKAIFEVNFNIEEPTHTKSELKAILERKLELHFRLDEIKRGELV